MGLNLHTIHFNEWLYSIEDDELPQLKNELTLGDYEKDLDPDEDHELTALRKFRECLPPGIHDIPHANHFIETGDTDTIFLPIAFDVPFEFYEKFVASLPRATQALEHFSRLLNFDLNSDFDLEHIDDEWQPMGTVRNVARIIYQFFKKNPNICIEFS